MQHRCIASLIIECNNFFSRWETFCWAIHRYFLGSLYLPFFSFRLINGQVFIHRKTQKRAAFFFFFGILLRSQQYTKNSTCSLVCNMYVSLSHLLAVFTTSKTSTVGSVSGHLLWQCPYSEILLKSAAREKKHNCISENSNGESNYILSCG